MEVAFREKTEKLTPSGVMVAPRGRGFPGLHSNLSKCLRLFDLLMRNMLPPGPAISLLYCSDGVKDQAQERGYQKDGKYRGDQEAAHDNASKAPIEL